MKDKEGNLLTCDDCCRFSSGIDPADEQQVHHSRCTVANVRVTSAHTACVLFPLLNPDKCTSPVTLAR
jgi:hypothetical protein